METDAIQSTLRQYEEQLNQIQLNLSTVDNEEDRNNLLSLESDIKQLIELTKESLPSSSATVDDEYALFMSEMVKEGAVEAPQDQINLKEIEGSKCRAPHKHSWGDVVYHNALICTALPDLLVKVLFINPTHQEMLPCPYFLESECKFSEEKCRFSHGEVVQFATLEDYIEPDYDRVAVGSFVLAKGANKLWQRATVKRLTGEKCVVRFDSNKKEVEVDLSDVLPSGGDDGSDESGDDTDDNQQEDVINMSLMITPTSEKIGDWEKFTKGVGSKLMAKMGYVIGTGLGKRSDGRVDPVTAVILPPGKSLDHCMHLREKSGGDANLFSVERKMKRQQKKQERMSEKAYERESKKVDVFDFINDTLTLRKAPSAKSEHRTQIKAETCRSLNVESLKVDEGIKEVERDLWRIRESLQRHQDANSTVHKQLKKKLGERQAELEALQGRARNIKNEQSMRSDKKKLTIF